MKIRIKYFKDATKLGKIAKGNWIDVYANETVFIPLGEQAVIPLGFALELPKGYEGHLIARSSTFKKWGVIQTNGMGIIDDSYIGDKDEWGMPLYCLVAKGFNKELAKGTWVECGDKIGQFRIMESMPNLELEQVDSFGNEDRGGFGTTGSK